MASSHSDCKACGDCKCPKYLDLALWGIMAEKCRWDNLDFRADIENQIIQSSDAIREELINLMASNENFINCISGTGTTNTDKVNLRFRIWEETLEKIVGVPKTEPRLFSPDFKRQLYESNSECAICGNKIVLFEDATVDHIDPYCSGGKTTEDNARLAHRYCNLRRGGNKAVPSP